MDFTAKPFKDRFALPALDPSPETMRMRLSLQGRLSTNVVAASFGHTDAPPCLDAAGRPTTRALLLEMRRKEMVADNTTMAMRSTKLFPAPTYTNRPRAEKFTAYDVMRIKPMAGRDAMYVQLR
jgi:hypothetical protein